MNGWTVMAAPLELMVRWALPMRCSTGSSRRYARSITGLVPPRGHSMCATRACGRSMLALATGLVSCRTMVLAAHGTNETRDGELVLMGFFGGLRMCGSGKAPGSCFTTESVYSVRSARSFGIMAGSDSCSFSGPSNTSRSAIKRAFCG